ncbi:UBX domain-containing protein 6-like isoform X2 [Watersipora subatra]|uniref:UBX domain-containing protein 6-like isoform X2 n=1 Tax=Watersipora subatra TaxID=2589382 RepID=UPI00355B0AF3
MSAIKKFFEKKKLDKKFKKAGEGHTLNSVREVPVHVPKQMPIVEASRPKTAAQQQAAGAALNRLHSQPAGTPTVRTGREVIKAQVKRELAQERKLAEEAQHLSRGPEEVKFDAAQVVDACGGVFFTCPLLPKVMLPRKEMEVKIEEFLTAQLAEDAEMASALLIHTVNKDIDKVKVCIETLCKYIDNLLDHPGEEKFRKIRCGNKAFQERVCSVTGGKQFLVCAGYQLERLPGVNGGEEDFYVIPEGESTEPDKLNHLKEVLTNSEPIRPVLWRAPRLFHCPGNTTPRFGELPTEFYAISKEEIKREQQAREEAVQKLGMLRTKAMRERDELRELRKYRYTLLRIRFPEDIYLQAIFKSNETLQHLQGYVQEQLEFDWLPFSLLDPQGQKLNEEEKTLAELHLVPACIVKFNYDKDLLKDAQQGSGRPRHVLQQALLDRLENWSI